jgi:PTH1 family peptidyl-tRNA hydrolase
MKLIVGLGNYKKEYEKTRHNTGFLVINEIGKNPELLSVNQNNIKMQKQTKFQSEMVQCSLNGEKFIMAKPQTFMNFSGLAVKKIADFYKIKPYDIWIVCDDFSLPLGRIRTRLGGSSGGHNGLQNVIDQLGGDEFHRIRVGISPLQESEKSQTDTNLELDEFVLAEFKPREKKVIEKATEKAANIIIEGLINNRLECRTYL